METLQITKEQAIEAYKIATPDTKKVLEKLFKKETFITDIRDRVKSYEDACELLGLTPLTLEQFSFLPEKDREYHYHDHRMVIITRALNEGWEPDPSNPDEPKYYVWHQWVSSGSGFAYYICSYVHSLSYVGARHEIKSKELAVYFAKQFI